MFFLLFNKINKKYFGISNLFLECIQEQLWKSGSLSKFQILGFSSENVRV